MFFKEIHTKQLKCSIIMLIKYPKNFVTLFIFRMAKLYIKFKCTLKLCYIFRSAQELFPEFIWKPINTSQTIISANYYLRLDDNVKG